MTIVFSSSNGWITPRALQGQVATNNSQIILNQSIDKVLINLPNLRISFLNLGVQPDKEK